MPWTSITQVWNVPLVHLSALDSPATTASFRPHSHHFETITGLVMSVQIDDAQDVAGESVKLGRDAGVTAATHESRFMPRPGISRKAISRNSAGLEMS